MAEPLSIDQLEKDFRSGRNPLAFLPLCQALRRRGSFSAALETCRKGLAKNPGSTAGQAMLARLLNDLEKQDEALSVAEAALGKSPEAMGLLIEKARALIDLERYSDAKAVVEQLNLMNATDPQVQALDSKIKRAIALGVVQATPSQVAVAKLDSINSVEPREKLGNQEIAEELSKEIKTLCPVLSCCVVPKGAGEPGLVGESEIAESGYSFYKGAWASCNDLDAGAMEAGIMETERVTVFVLVRPDAIVTLGTKPSAQFGKILYRMQMVVNKYLDNPDEAASE